MTTLQLFQRRLPNRVGHPNPDLCGNPWSASHAYIHTSRCVAMCLRGLPLKFSYQSRRNFGAPLFLDVRVQKPADSLWNRLVAWKKYKNWTKYKKIRKLPFNSTSVTSATKFPLGACGACCVCSWGLIRRSLLANHGHLVIFNAWNSWDPKF